MVSTDKNMPEMFNISGTDMKKLADSWVNKIAQSEKIYAPFYEMIHKTRSAYKAQQNSIASPFLPSNGAYNVFWSGIETQKPFLYFKRPEVYVERVNKIASTPEIIAGKILERALKFNLSQFDFDSVVKYARNDYLISGCGILWEQYKPTFKSIITNAQNQVISAVKESEIVVSTYIDPLDFLMDTTNAHIFEQVSWVARKIYLSIPELYAQFDAAALAPLGITDTTDETTSICIYEIWDKATRQVIWLCREMGAHIIHMQKDPLHLKDFFPCPKPIFATLTNDSLIPIPDFAMIQQMLDELNGVCERIRLTMQALKVSGVYDNSISNLADIFQKDVSLVSLSDFDKLKEAGGIQGVIDFVPITQYITTLEALAQRREDLSTQIFEITGVSDIMRGNSNQTDTATAIEKKTNFGTLRNQDRQNDIQRFISDLYSIKAELICTHFSMDSLAEFISPEEGYSVKDILQGISILKNKKLIGMIIHVHTQCILNQDSDSEKTISGVNTILQLITTAITNISKEPLLLPLYRQMIMAITATLPDARIFESVIDQTFNNIEQNIS